MEWKLPMFRTLIAGVVAVIVVAQPGAAQAQSASALSGFVRDTSGAPVPGALVRVIAESAGTTVEKVSDEQGAYRAEALSSGRYRVETVLEGFETTVRRVVLEPGQAAALDLILTPSRLSEAVVVTARRVEETVQEVPIPVSVVSGELVETVGAFNVNRVKDLIPTVQFYSTNPRNSAINIRGLGAPFGLTNDGIEAGVGLYVDGVFYARPAAATLDFLDLERIEVLRGPQGTLFGKNTTAGAINVTTRRPSFTPQSDFELNYGNLGFVQAKGSVTGALFSKVAGRVSFSGTQRDGTVYNAATRAAVNDLSNIGARGQLLIAPSDRLAINATFDHTRQRPDGYTQVVAGVAPTLRPANRQYPQIAADLGYTPPSFNAFDRLTDVDTPLRSYQDLGGSSVNIDWKVGGGQVTSTTAWRYWDWNPSNDRDFIGLPVTTISAAPSKQRQWTQEVRYAGALATQRQSRCRRLRLSPDDRLGFVVQTGARVGCRPLPPRADRAGGDAGPSRRLRLRPVRQLRERQRGRLRPGLVGRHRPAAAFCLACASTTTRRKSASISRSTAVCRPTIRRSSRCSAPSWRRRRTTRTSTIQICPGN